MADIKSNKKKDGFPIPVSSYSMILIGLGIIVLGFMLMIGGGSTNPNEFNYDIFSFRRITLAPIVSLIGFAFVFWAIMRKPKSVKNNK